MSKAYQLHGEVFENEIIKNTFGYPCQYPTFCKAFKHTNYFGVEFCLCAKKTLEDLIPGGHSSSMDIPKGIYNGVEILENESIKTSSSRGFSLGDVGNFRKHLLSNNTKVIVGRYTQSGNYKLFGRVYELVLKPNHYKKIFGSINNDKLDDYVCWINNRPSSPKEVDDITKIQYCDKYPLKIDNILYETNSIIKINTKVGKGNDRVQCSLNIEELSAVGIKSVKFENEYREIRLPYKIWSPPRNYEVKLLNGKKPLNGYEKTAVNFFENRA